MNSNSINIELEFLYAIMILGDIMGLLEWLNRIGTEEQENKKKNTAKKEDNDLMPHEQEEINKGNYEPFNFEEEELEDDDYYSEDDDMI